MKPIKNQVFCYGCGRAKMLFETEKKALDFIRYNAEEIQEKNGYAPVRAYYCCICGGWHVTSMPSFDHSRPTPAERFLAQYERKQEELRLAREAAKKQTVARIEIDKAEKMLEKAEKMLEKIEACLAEDNHAQARNYCFSAIDYLRSHSMEKVDAARQGQLMQRLIHLVDKCINVDKWLKKANDAAKDALMLLQYGDIHTAYHIFLEGTRCLTEACETEGKEKEKAATLQALSDVQDKIWAITRCYSMGA